MQTPIQIHQHNGFIISPEKALPGNPWIWRTTFPEYHDEIDQLLVKNGFHLCYLDVVAKLGSDSAIETMHHFYSYVRNQWGLGEKPALEAVSRGGLHAYRYAARYPQAIACIYADTPVMDLKSWPLKWNLASHNLQEALTSYGWTTNEELIAFQGNPIDLLPQIASAKIPLRHLISMNDQVVPPEENTLEAKKRLNQLGWDIDLVVVENGTGDYGHHFPLIQISETVDFITNHTRIK